MRKKLWRLWLKVKFHAWQKRRFNQLILEQVAGKPFLILPDVFNPTLFYSSEFLVANLNEDLIPNGSTVLDMGTGSGVGAIFAARWAERVIAVDINPVAVRCAQINCLLNNVHETVSVFQGDLFAPIRGETFDAILFNPPYYRGVALSALDMAFHANDVVERFISELRQYLKPTGHALVLLSDVGDEEAFLTVFRAHELQVLPVAQDNRPFETLTLYRLTRAPESQATPQPAG